MIMVIQYICLQLSRSSDYIIYQVVIMVTAYLFIVINIKIFPIAS